MIPTDHVMPKQVYSTPELLTMHIKTECTRPLSLTKKWCRIPLYKKDIFRKQQQQKQKNVFYKVVHPFKELSTHDIVSSPHRLRLCTCVKNFPNTALRVGEPGKDWGNLNTLTLFYCYSIELRTCWYMWDSERKSQPLVEFMYTRNQSTHWVHVILVSHTLNFKPVGRFLKSIVKWIVLSILLFCGQFIPNTKTVYNYERIKKIIILIWIK